jgi:hypothetical protein
MKMQELAAILKADLEQQLEATYSVAAFCRHAQITRSRFYRRYNSLAYFAAACLLWEVRTCLAANCASQQLAALLQLVKDNQTYFCNLKKLLFNRHAVVARLEQEFLKSMQSLGPLSEQEARVVFRLLAYWLITDCQENERQLLEELRWVISSSRLN